MLFNTCVQLATPLHYTLEITRESRPHSKYSYHDTEKEKKKKKITELKGKGL